MTTALSCRSVTSGYKGVPAVRGLDLTVDAGEIVALLGANGAGKTTTLLTLAGVLRPTAGEVEVLGEPCRPGRPHVAWRRGLTLVPDDRGLSFGLTTRQNITLCAARRRRAAAVEMAVELFPALAKKLDVRAGLLSGGEQQMLAIGRALARESRALLIDEMSMGLAAVVAQSILPILRRAADEFGTAVLLVEQHLDKALSIADRGYVLRHGVVTDSGSAAELRQRRSVVRASYLGELSQKEPTP